MNVWFIDNLVAKSAEVPGNILRQNLTLKRI